METCVFCGAPLHQKHPERSEMVYIEMCHLPFNKLAALHTYDLLVLLRLVRKERSQNYDLMRSAQKLSNSPSIDQEMLNYTEEQYKLYTKRMKVIEGILIDRMGYKPERIDDNLLAKLDSKVKKFENRKEKCLNG